MKFSEYVRYDGLGLAQLVKSKQVTAQELLETAHVKDLLSLLMIKMKKKWIAYT